MASPIDVAEYLGLDLIDVDAQELVEQFLANAAARFPDWTPIEGNTEVVLAEELAALIEEDGHTVNSVTDNVVEVILGMYGITRYLGAAATATVQFSAYDTDGYVIPAGTLVRANRDDDEVDLTTDTDATIPAGSTTINVLATAVEAGAAWNGPA
ncbi:MAG: baseplate J/gp47 family protein, partial [Burkholderiaceae bacterium]